jgi:hypothetical protein
VNRQAQLPNEASTKPPLPPAQGREAIDTATLDLLTAWRLDDATDNVDEIRAAERELSEFKKAMNETRTLAGELPIYP